MDFSSILSLGEQQRLAFGRLLYNRCGVCVRKPLLLLLDLPCPSALGHPSPHTTPITNPHTPLNQSNHPQQQNNSPKLAILDEATSALDLASEEKMYTVLGSIPGISYVSVGHRPSLVSFHDARLTLTGGGYSIEKLGEGALNGAAVV